MSEKLEDLTPNQRRANGKALAALETMAAMWGAEIGLWRVSLQLSRKPEAERAKAIAAFIEQAFIEGAYRHYLDRDPGANTDRASQPGSGEASSVVCINAKELLDVLELAAPDVMPEIDRDHEQMDTEMCIGRLSGSIDDDSNDSGPGLLAWYTEYPEEGVIPLRLDRDVRASIDSAVAAPSAGNGEAKGER